MINKLYLLILKFRLKRLNKDKEELLDFCNYIETSDDIHTIFDQEIREVEEKIVELYRKGLKL